ncbi:tetratricopeptide repeat protein [Aeoliella sp. SH292]|uniref:tetratricopeptide repeat protein n=1 Tax=Aeoliella sp. SH292 TaxID=3454464 RepID=UPI003F9A11B6
MSKRAFFLLAIVIGIASVARAKDARPMIDGYYNIGTIHWPVSTESETAQKWFDRGVAMCIGFNHEEAVRCFDRALEADPELAMAYWGKSYALGPNFNNMEILAEQMLLAHAAIEEGKKRLEGTTDAERALIDAVAKRTSADVPEDFALRVPFNQTYADAMREVHAKHGDDSLVAMLYAESLMNLQPWKHWSPDGTPGEHTAEIVTTLEEAMEDDPTHPGLCHLYIHAIEASPTPEKALVAANHLRNAVPGSGHLLHMPTHIDVRLGHYEDVIRSNRRGIEIDKQVLEREGPVNFYTMYRIHNYHFLCYGAMFDGQSKLAMEAARAIPQQVPEEMLKAQVDFLDAYMPTAMHVMVRFGQWDEVLAEPEYADYLPMSRAVRHYARTIAYAATGRVKEAEAERELFKAAAAAVPETNLLFQNKSRAVLEVADAMIDGEIAYRKGEFDAAFDHLREAVRRDDGLNYDEPWGWMQPARHALGALLLEQKRYAEAEKVYREDLERHPHNPWALHGLAEALMEQDELVEAREIATECQQACERADVKINRSCFCRLMVNEDTDAKD